MLRPFLCLSEEVLQEKQLDLSGGLGYLDIPLYGGHGEAVNTYDCDSYIRGFDPLWPPQKSSKRLIRQLF